MNNCPCCSRPLLRHIRHNSIYWFCSRCHQEMPVLEVTDSSVDQEFKLVKTLNKIFPEQMLISASR